MAGSIIPAFINFIAVNSDSSSLPANNLYNESELVKAMQAGSQEAFTSLYRHYSPLLYMNILRMIHDPVTTEELVQELFTRIWQKRACKGIQENFTGYMYRIAQHLVHDFFRRLKKDQALLKRFRAMAQEVDEAASAEDRLQQQQSIGLINTAIELLPPQQKKAYKLVKQEGYTYKKAAEDMGISPFTVKEYLTLANKSIRDYILTHAGSSRELILLTLIPFFLQ